MYGTTEALFGFKNKIGLRINSHEFKFFFFSLKYSVTKRLQAFHHPH